MSQYKGKATLEVLEGADNYNRWIAGIILRNIHSPVLEIGAGTGNITSYFSKVKSLYATDVDPSLVTELKKKFLGKNNITCSVIDIEKITQKHKIGFFSSIFGVNVLEHIRDDERALRNMHKLLKKDGSIVLLVPAKKFAYTRLDKELGHYRRYEKEELREKMEDVGFMVDEIFYFNIVGLLSWVVRDKVERKNIYLKPYQIALFDSIVPILRACEAVVHPPVGISIIVYARKK